MVQGVPHRGKIAQICTQVPHSVQRSLVSRRTENNGEEEVQIEQRNQQAIDENKGKIYRRGNGNNHAPAAENAIIY
jgi:hypothetical protein